MTFLIKHTYMQPSFQINEDIKKSFLDLNERCAFLTDVMTTIMFGKQLIFYTNIYQYNVKNDVKNSPKENDKIIKFGTFVSFCMWSLSFPLTGEILAINNVMWYVNKSCPVWFIRNKDRPDGDSKSWLTGVLVRPDPASAFRVCFWNQGLVNVSALSLLCVNFGFTCS